MAGDPETARVRDPLTIQHQQVGLDRKLLEGVKDRRVSRNESRPGTYGNEVGAVAVALSTI
jgi:hypothetical protein